MEAVDALLSALVVAHELELANAAAVVVVCQQLYQVDDPHIGRPWSGCGWQCLLLSQ